MRKHLTGCWSMLVLTMLVASMVYFSVGLSLMIVQPNGWASVKVGAVLSSVCLLVGFIFACLFSNHRMTEEEGRLPEKKPENNSDSEKNCCGGG